MPYGFGVDNAGSCNRRGSPGGGQRRAVRRCHLRFAAGDVIDAGSVGFVTGTATVGFNAGTLTVSEGTQGASFNLSGGYAANGFQIIGSDGHGGSEVGYG